MHGDNQLQKQFLQHRIWPWKKTQHENMLGSENWIGFDIAELMDKGLYQVMKPTLVLENIFLFANGRKAVLYKKKSHWVGVNGLKRDHYRQWLLSTSTDLMCADNVSHFYYSLLISRGGGLKMSFCKLKIFWLFKLQDLDLKCENHMTFSHCLYNQTSGLGDNLSLAKNWDYNTVKVRLMVLEGNSPAIKNDC